MMFTLQILDNTDPLPGVWLEPFKQYASVPDDGRDALLESLLKSAILRVQEYGDRALVRCRVRQTGTPDPETGLFRLYLGGGEDVSVTFDYDGSPAPWTRNTDGSLTIRTHGSPVSVEFTTVPLASWKEQAKSTVFRYATALYDGADVATLNSILNEVL
jgi:hypothetical protein